MKTYHMRHDELEAVQILDRLDRKELTEREAALQLGLGIRQTRRKLKSYRRGGPASLAHGARGKPSHNRIPEAIRQEAKRIVGEEYPDFGPSFAAEKLREYHGIVLSHETLRLLMTEAGIWKTKPQRQKEVHTWRERRACRGELVQLDGSPHDWFEERAPSCCLLAFIDDATSELLWAEFADSESTESLMCSSGHYLEKDGRPLALYTDRGGVYKVNLHNEDEEKLTQFTRAVQELGIEPIFARSPQAKGRVERVFGTLQDRLVKELRLRGIASIEEANRYLATEYLPAHNARFAVPPREPADLHRSLDGYELGEILCLKKERTLTPDRCIRYRNRWFQLERKQPTILATKEVIEVRLYPDSSVGLWLRGMRLTFTELANRPAKSLPPVQPVIIRQVVKQSQKAGCRSFLYAA